jgi:hypothetical protein
MSEEEFSDIQIDFIMAFKEADLDKITKAMGLAPTRTQKNGEWPTGITRANKACDVWVISTERKHSVWVEKSFSHMIDMLKGKEGTIKYLTEKYDMELVFHVVVYAEAIFLPGLTLEKESVQFLADLNASMDFKLHIQ